MPLTEIQKKIGRLLASNRSEDRYLAGGAGEIALHYGRPGGIMPVILLD